MQQKLVIVGAGFAGIALAKKLKNTSYFDVLILDSKNYNTFQPLLYQVATGGLEESQKYRPSRKAHTAPIFGVRALSSNLRML